MFIQILILVLLLIAVPLMVGTLFWEKGKSVSQIPFCWISGQILLWAGFQLICVPFVLAEKRFETVIGVFNGFTAVMVVLALVLGIKKAKVKKTFRVVKERDKTRLFLWGIVVLLLAVQLLCAVFLAYEEGDDAYYVAISTAAVKSGHMYKTIPYTGMTTELDVRHGLAPFPIWGAYLAKVSGMPAVTVAQIALPVVVIAMAYALYYCIGKAILAGKQKFLPLFMIIVEVMVLYGGYTTYSAENFLLVRSAQGKAVISAIVIPFMFLLLYELLERLQKEEKVKPGDWLLLLLTQTAGCLCSTLGTLLTCMLAAIVGMCIIVCYRKWKMLLPMATCCIPPVCYAILYFWIG